MRGAQGGRSRRYRLVDRVDQLDPVGRSERACQPFAVEADGHADGKPVSQPASRGLREPQALGQVQVKHERPRRESAFARRSFLPTPFVECHTRRTRDTREVL